MQGSNGIFNSLRHCIHFALFSDVLVTDNSFDSSFYSREVLVVVLVQCICLGNGFIDLGVVSILVLQGGNGIFDCLCHRIYLGLLGNVLVTDNSVDGSFHTGEVLVVILVQCICFGNGFVYLAVICGNVALVPSKGWIVDPLHPLCAVFGIGIKCFQKASIRKIINCCTCGISTFCIGNVRSICIIIWPEAVFCISIYDISQPASISMIVITYFFCSHKAIFNLHTFTIANNATNGSLNGVYNDFSPKPAVTYCNISCI